MVNKYTCSVCDMNKNHICIVKARKSDEDGIGYDYLASLLMTLRHDKMTVQNIHTLEKYGYLRVKRVGKVLDVQLQPLAIKELGIVSVGAKRVEYINLLGYLG